MNDPEDAPKNQLVRPDEIIERTQIQSVEGIPIKVSDLRDPSARTFDLEKFISTIVRLKKEGLFKLSSEFQQSDYGKYMSVFASAESDNWDEAIQNARAIEITLTTPANRGIEYFIGKTDVEVKILMGKKEGRVFNFSFNKEGGYSQGNWKDVHLQKRLGEKKTDQDFTLTIGPNSETKKLE